MSTINTRPLKAFVRFDGSGRIVAGSLILRKNKPKVGKWKEIQAYECCNFVPTTTTTTTAGLTTTTTTADPTLCATFGRAAKFAVLGHTTVDNSRSTVIRGDLGLSPGTSVTGFPPGIVLGTQYITDTAAANAKTDAQAAFTALNALTSTGSLAADIGGTTITPGVYKANPTLAITGTVTLDGGGNPNAVFIFQIDSTFTPAVGAIVGLTNGAQPGNVYWVVGSSATLNTTSSIAGNIIAQTFVTMDTSAKLTGRAFALTGAVTMDENNVTVVPCTINPI
jgi:hypothetical protein